MIQALVSITRDLAREHGWLFAFKTVPLTIGLLWTTEELYRSVHELKQKTATDSIQE
jgi:hypothetical protein